MNQETNLKHPGDTRWGSYYGTILNLILMFSVENKLDIIHKLNSSPKLDNKKYYMSYVKRTIRNLHSEIYQIL